MDNGIFDPFPAGFNYNKEYKSATCIVHPGYSIYSAGGRNARDDIGKYGSYNTYLDNLLELVKRQRSLGELTILAVEQDVLSMPKLEEKLSVICPFDISLVIATDASSMIHDSFSEKVLVNGKSIKQDINFIYNLLQSYGITELRFAGEYVWYLKYENNEEGPGCVPTAALIFQREGFSIKGVKECVFPLKAPPTKKNSEIGEIKEKLYGDAISVL